MLKYKPSILAAVSIYLGFLLNFDLLIRKHQIEFNNEVVPTNGNPANKLKKIDSKKFFKSKIDFAAPIKILQNRGAQEAQLSDDSYNELN